MAAVWFLLVAASVAAVAVLLARSSDKLGAALRLDRSMTGFLMLAAATSLPELVVSCQVARSGAIDMAVGSVLGSCLMNLLILAGIDLSRRSGGHLFSRQTAAHALAALASVLLASFVAFAVLVPMTPLFGRFHWGSLLLLIGYIMTFRLVYIDRQLATADAIVEVADESLELRQTLPTPSMRRPAIVYAISTLGIFALAPTLASTSEELAALLRLSGTFFGAVFLALVTSLPEVVTTVEASRMNANDLAVGNILGSNTFNLLILVAIDLVYEKPLFSSIAPAHAVAAVGIVVTTTLATMGLLYRVEKRVWYLEPDALAVTLSAIAFFYLLYVL
jgi:cation:H+ antiporter